MRSASVLLAAVAFSACAPAKPKPAPAPQTPPRVGRESARDTELQRRIERLELRVLEKETQVDELQTRLEDTRDEVVRTMAKLQTAASRAEAASGMAEAEVALRSLRANAAGQQVPEIGQAQKLVQQSSAEFDKQNFGGALYLADQAKATAASGNGRLAAGNRGGAARAGETPFAVPIRLKVESKGNVREGPGTNYAVAFEVEGGNRLTAYSYIDEWVRVHDGAGRSGWIFRSLVTRP